MYYWKNSYLGLGAGILEAGRGMPLPAFTTGGLAIREDLITGCLMPTATRECTFSTGLSTACNKFYVHFNTTFCNKL